MRTNAALLFREPVLFLVLWLFAPLTGFNQTAPALLWGTFQAPTIGGTSEICESAGGHIVHVGVTNVLGLATDNTVGDPNGRAYIAAYDATLSQLLWFTYFGDVGTTPISMKYSSLDNSVVIAGTQTQLYNGFITLGPVMTTEPKGTFVLKYGLFGSLVWGRFIGDQSVSYLIQPTAMDVSTLGTIALAGNAAQSADMPIVNTLWQSMARGYGDVFLLTLNASGAFLWSTYAGGNGLEEGYDVDFDSQGNLYLPGEIPAWWPNTLSTTYIATDATFLQGPDGFLMKFSPTGQRLWGTYVGGSGGENRLFGSVDGSDGYVLGGTTTSSDFAVVAPIQASLNGVRDCFLRRYDSMGNTTRSTYWGGSGDEELRATQIEASGDIILACYTTSTGLATPNAYGSVGQDFYLRLASNWSTVWGTYMISPTSNGNTRWNTFIPLASGNLCVSGYSVSSIATPGAYSLIGPGMFIGIFGAADPVDCLNIPNGTNLPGTPCDDGDPLTFNDEWDVNCDCVGVPCTDNLVTLEITTDGNGSQTWWEIVPSAGGAAVATGGDGGTYPSNSTFTEEICLPNGCYQLNFYDTGNNGMCCTFGNGGYVLWDENGDAIIDNRTGTGTGDGFFTGLSSVKNNNDFCVPLGPVRMENYPAALTHTLHRISPICSNANSDPLQATPDATINGALGWASTDGYRFQLFDPDGHGVGTRRGWDWNASPPVCSNGGWVAGGYLRQTNLREVDNGPFTLNAPAAPPSERCSYENPSGWVSYLPPTGIWLNMRVARVINGAVENYGPVSRVLIEAPTNFRDANELSETAYEMDRTNGLSVIPNPSTNGLVQLWVPDVVGEEPIVVQLTDMMGREVYVRRFDTNGNSELLTTVDWSALGSGLYVVRASMGDSTRTTRLVIE